PSMGVICFRFIDADEKKVDQLNSDIVARINASGRAYLTQTKLRGRIVMRIGLGNVLTTEEKLAKGGEIIQEKASNLWPTGWAKPGPGRRVSCTQTPPGARRLQICD